MNRYPEEYSAVQNYFQTLASEGRHPSGSINQKLLSFGASTGEEAITLASMYFMNSTFTIFGVDLDEDSLDKAKASAVAHSPKFDDNKIMFFNGKTTDISVHGPYDAIFANSVLCYHGNRNVNPQSILNKFPFSAFEDSLGYLDTNLNVGGILAIVNTNYHFSDTKLYKRYKTLAQCKNFVPKVNASSVSYEKNLHGGDNMYDCVWKKEE
jgi:chemotaxis methyl-accepting protein methylase